MNPEKLEELRQEAKEEEYHNRRLLEDFDYAIEWIIGQYELDKVNETLWKAYQNMLDIGYDISYKEFLDEVIE